MNLLRKVKMIENLTEVFNRFEGEFLKFERVENKLHPRKDLCAFLLLDKLVPDTRNIVAAAQHDEIYLGTECSTLAKVATEEDIINLIRCGVRYDYDTYSLCMFT